MWGSLDELLELMFQGLLGWVLCELLLLVLLVHVLDLLLAGVFIAIGFLLDAGLFDAIFNYFVDMVPAFVLA